MSDDRKPRLDGAINIPTLLALLGFMVAQGFLPGGITHDDITECVEGEIAVHAESVHPGSVPLATYQIEREHDRETMGRIEVKVDAIAEDVEGLQGRRR